MSIHIQLTPEAQSKLKAQQRTSTILSVVISALILTLLGLLLYFIFLKPLFVENPTIVTYVAETEPEDDIQTKKVTTTVKRKPSAPSSSMAKVIASNSPSPVTIPVPEFESEIPQDFGSGDDFGADWGAGDSAGGGSFASIPVAMKKRCSKTDRLSRLESSGGNQACEDAVVKGLDWLQNTQRSDGSWVGGKHSVGMTGLALLAFLGHCETPLSIKYGETVTNAINYLVDKSAKGKGKLASDFNDKHWCYEHGIATYALSEANTFCSQMSIDMPGLEEAAYKAADWIAENQSVSGAWSYDYDIENNGDLSIAAWQIQALKAAEYSGWKHKRWGRVKRDALDYVEKNQDRKSGGIGYRGPKGWKGRGGFTLTGAGALCHQISGKSRSSLVRKAVEHISKERPFNFNDPEWCNMYCVYYSVQAMINHGGSEWDAYNKQFRDSLLSGQVKDGSWKSAGGGKPVALAGAQWNGSGTEPTHYRTCLAILSLEVYYRFLPGTGQKN